MPNNTISQVEVNGTTYDLLDANTLSAVSSLAQRVSTLEDSVDTIQYSLALAYSAFRIDLPSSTTTAITYTNIKRNAIVGVIFEKNDDIYYQPITWSVTHDGGIEVRRINVSDSNQRTYWLQVYYLPSLNT